MQLFAGISRGGPLSTNEADLGTWAHGHCSLGDVRPLSSGRYRLSNFDHRILYFLAFHAHLLLLEQGLVKHGHGRPTYIEQKMIETIFQEIALGGPFL